MNAKQDKQLSLHPIAKHASINCEGKLYESLLVVSFCRIYEKQNKLSSIIPHDVLEIIVLYVPKSYEVLGVGSNCLGEFGIGINKELKYLQNLSWRYCDHPSSIHVSLTRFTIKSIYNELYSTGCNSYGILGIGDKTKPFLPYFTLIDINNIDKNDYIDIISNGIYSYSSIIKTRKNKFYACGTNQRTQFGTKYPSMSPFDKYTELPALNKIFTQQNLNVIKIECGLSHTLFLTSTGKIFVCGDNRLGQAGQEINAANYNIHIGTPKCIDDEFNVKYIDISTGSAHNLCLSSDHKVYAFGANTYGQLGLDSVLKSIWKPQIVYFHNISNTIIKIQSGPFNSACIDIDGNCFVFGYNVNYQFGSIGDNSGNVDKGTIRKPVLFKYKNIDSASINMKHSVFLTRHSEVITCGDNMHNQCSSTKATFIIKEPYKLSRVEIGLKPYDVVQRAIAGYRCTIIVAKKTYGQTKKATKRLN